MQQTGVMAGDMDMKELQIVRHIAEELGLSPSQVEAAVQLLDEGNTIPFLARYRKERTGNLDENQLRAIQEKAAYYRHLEVRRQEVHRLIEAGGHMTEELAAAIQQATTLAELEDLYRPFRPKRRTRASVAREKGLEPLAQWLKSATCAPWTEAARYLSEEKGVSTVEQALQGALDILAEEVSDSAEHRKWIRAWTMRQATLVAKAADPGQPSIYEMYYSFSQAVDKLPPHRILAINRGEREGFLKVSLEMPADALLERLERMVLRSWGRVPKPQDEVLPLLQSAIADAYKRLIAPSIEREVRAWLTEKAEAQAIRLFAANLRQLLMQPPVRGKVVMGIDPAYRTGCKVAVVDQMGKLLEVAVVYPTPPQNRVREAKEQLLGMCQRHQVELIAIGNGTASRETELFVAEMLREAPHDISYLVVSEAGASVYSASPLAAEEFPDLDVSERSAISIARRLQDPLAELVKVEPRSLGVGQYQHDVSPKALEEQLAFVVEWAVNTVGVDLNTASVPLLSYVAGLSRAQARAIVQFREQHGGFGSRAELLQVPRLGPRTFEQCAGFLRIPGGAHPLDDTPIHPESYGVVEQLIEEMGMKIKDLQDRESWQRLKERLAGVDVAGWAERLGVGLHTLQDILEALQKPGRDPREEVPPPLFRQDVLRLEDLAPGMILVGTVRNLVDFGAFVDIGVQRDGLIHISEMSEGFIRHPMDVLSVGQIVRVRVIGVDVQKGRVSLSRKGVEPDSL